MSERLSVSSSFVEFPTSGLLVPDKKTIREENLAFIFGVDVKSLTKGKLVELGILAEGSELDFLDPPNIHRYEINNVVVESDAQYFVEKMVGQHEIKVSYMPEGKKASKHSHKPPMVEEYYVVAGEADLRMGDGTIHLNEYNRFIQVPSYVEHQLTTNSHPFFVLIVMRNSALLSLEQRHVFSREKSS